MQISTRKIKSIKVSTITSLILLLCLWGFATIGDLRFISDKLTATSELMLTAMEDDAAGVTDGGNSFAMTARILNFLPYDQAWLLNLIIGTLAIVYTSRQANTYKLSFVAIFLISPAIVLFMVRLLKESILLPVILITAIIISANIKKQWRVAAVVGLYILYGSFIRSYYVLIALAFIGLLTFFKGGTRTKFFVALLILSSPLIMPPHLYEVLQGGDHRGGAAMAHVRTAFANPFDADNFFGFAGNYINAIFRLNVPIFFTQSTLEIFHMISISCYSYIIYLGIRSDSWEKNIAAYLMLAQVIVLWLFEPDLGSYLRHLSTVFPIAAVIMAKAYTDKIRKDMPGN